MLEVHEDVVVRGGGPYIVERAFEFNRFDEQARHVAIVGVLAADADFADAGEVVDVVPFHFGAGEIADGSFEDELSELVGRDGLRGADGGESAAAIAAQAEVDTEAGSTFFEGGEVLGDICIRGREDDTLKVAHAVVLHADFKRSGVQADGHEGGLLDGGGELAVA